MNIKHCATSRSKCVCVCVCVCVLLGRCTTSNVISFGYSFRQYSKQQTPIIIGVGCLLYCLKKSSTGNWSFGIKL